MYTKSIQKTPCSIRELLCLWFFHCLLACCILGIRSPKKYGIPFGGESWRFVYFWRNLL